MGELLIEKNLHYVGIASGPGEDFCVLYLLITESSTDLCLCRNAWRFRGSCSKSSTADCTTEAGYQRGSSEEKGQEAQVWGVIEVGPHD